MAFTDKEILIGETAKNQIRKNSKNTIFNLERLIGTKHDFKDLNENIKFLPFNIARDNSNKLQIQITFENKEQKFYPENILSMIFQKLKKNASDFLGKEVKDAVITIPTYFNRYQIDEIKEAAKYSGLNVLRTIATSTAAGLDYCFDCFSCFDYGGKNILIFDLGGLSLNISLIRNEEGLVEVKSLNGNLNLGGEDFTYKLFEYCASEFKSQTGIDIKNNLKAVSRLFNSCEEAKITLSSAKEAYIDLEYLIEDKDFKIKITRDKFEDLCMDLFKKCIPPIDNALKDAKMTKSQIDEIILVGGSSRIPKIHQMVEEFFNGKEINKGWNCEEASAFGASIQAAIMTNVNSREIEKFVLWEAIPFSLGVEIVGGVMTVLIPRNSTIACKKTQIFSTVSDNQPTFTVSIYEGDRKLTKDNLLIGRLILDGIPPMPRGQPQIEITFDMDAKFNLNVTALEKSTGNKKQIAI